MGEVWSIIVDRNTAIKKIKQALRDKHVRTKKGGSCLSASLSSNKSSVSTSSPTRSSSLVADWNDGDVSMSNNNTQEEELKENDEYVYNDWPSAPSRLYASMPPLLPSPRQGLPNRDFSSMHIPYGLYNGSNSHSTGEVVRR